MRIGELAARTGVSVRSLRYYEQQRLLTSSRSTGGQRNYTKNAIERVGYIRRMFAAGLTSRTIADLLPCVDYPGEDTADSAAERMLRERDRLSEHIAELVRTRDSLDELIATNRAYRTAL
ncbi:MerR family transcriptional regulator [Kribbella sancticallisti]|uniref:MerR family transcriptional regulator n=1 Tax=Kribbella sancticallisti TaxID=460087 RepID=A0ABN2EYG8_9ACTN